VGKKEMSQKETTSATEITLDLDATMQKLSLVVSLLALSLMIGGFATKLADHITLAPPGISALPLAILLHPTPGKFSLEVMSAGIVLLTLLPIARVILAL
jgi:hypothetical protein